MAPSAGTGGRSPSWKEEGGSSGSGELVEEDPIESSEPSTSSPSAGTSFEITGRYSPADSWTRAKLTSVGSEPGSPRETTSKASPSSVLSTQHSDSTPIDLNPNLPPPTHVHVVVVAARGLRGADFTGFSDPFVEVSACGPAKKHGRYRTATATQTCNPNWDARVERFLVKCDGEDADTNDNDSNGDENKNHDSNDSNDSNDSKAVSPKTSSFRGIALSVFDRDWGASSVFLGGAVIDPNVVPRNGRWVEMTLELRKELPEFARPLSKKKKWGNKNKYQVSGATQSGAQSQSQTSLGTITVRVSAADDLSWDVVSDTGNIVRRAALDAFKPGKFSAGKVKTAASGYRALRKQNTSGRSKRDNNDSVPTLHPKLTRHVHVCVIAAKHLAASDSGRSTDAFVKVFLDNRLPHEKHKTGVIKRSLDPVWGNGSGETFTLTRRPGASEVVCNVYDSDFGGRNNQLISTGIVPLYSLPSDGSWSDTITIPLFVGGPSIGKDAAGESKGFLVLRVAGSSPVPRVISGVNDTRHQEQTGSVNAAVVATPVPPTYSFWPDTQTPPHPPPGQYVNKMESSSFVYFQVCGARDLPTPRDEATTNFRATVSLNSERQIKNTEVQEDVLADSVWVPQVFSFPRNPNAKFITVKVYGAATKLWDPDAVSGMTKNVTLGLVDMGKGSEKKGKKDGDENESFSLSSASDSVAEGLRKKRFASGTLLGEVKIPVDSLIIGADVEPVWASLVAADAAEDKHKSDKKKTACASFKKRLDVFGKPDWLLKRGTDLGEICIACRAGRLRQPPDDLVHPSDFGSRPQLGVLNVQVLSAEGDERALDAAKGDPAGWFKTSKKAKKTHTVDRSNDSEFESDSDEDDVPENTRVTEAVSGGVDTVDGVSPGTVDTVDTAIDLSNPSSRDSELLGTRVSARLVYEGRAERVSSPFEHRTFDVTEPTAELRVLLFGEGTLALDEVFLGAAVLPVSQILKDGSIDAWLDVFGPCKENTERNLQDVEYRVRLRSVKRRHGWRGRVRVKASISTDKALYQWYLRQPARHSDTGGGDSKLYVDDTIKGVLHSLERVVTALLAPITAPVAALGHVQNPNTNPKLPRAWIAWHTALSFLAQKHLLTSFKVLWYVSGMVFIGYVSAQARALDSPAEPYHGGKVVKSLSGEEKEPVRKITGNEEELVSQDPSEGVSSEVRAMGVQHFEFESKAEQCRLRVQRWLKELRVRRKKVLIALEKEQRAEALRVRGKSPKAVMAMMKRTQSGRQSTETLKDKPKDKNKSGNQKLILEDAGVDDDDPMQILLRRLRLKKLAQIMSSANPAEVVMRLLQQVTWTLLVLLKSTGATVFNVGVSLGKVHRMLASPCKKVCNILDPLADSLERLGGVLSWRDSALSNYVSVLLVATALVFSLLFRVIVTPLWHLFDCHSPVRAWHVAWLVGILPCLRIKPVTKICHKICVICERLVQNLLGALKIQPISPYTLTLLEGTLYEEFANAGGTWEGVEKVLRNVEVEKSKIIEAKQAAANLKLRDELRKGTGLNPLRWLTHATKRAPTRAEYEHKKLVERFVEVEKH